MNFTKLFMTYEEQDRELINKMITDLKNIGVFIIRNEMSAGSDGSGSNYKERIKGNDYALFLITENFKKSGKCTMMMNRVNSDPDYNEKMIFISADKGMTYEGVNDYMMLDDIYSSNYGTLFAEVGFDNTSELVELAKAKNIMDMQERLKVLDELEAKYGETKNLLTLKANTIYRTKDFEAARQMLDRVLQFESDDAEENYEYAVILEDYFGDISKAKKHYEKAISLDDKYEDAYYNLALLQTKHFKAYDEAIKNYDKVIELNPNKAAAYYNKAILIKSEKQDVEEARKLYEKTIELDPSNSKAYNNLANIYVSVDKDYDKARELFEKSIEMNPYDGQICFNYANILKTQYQDYDNAKAMYENSIRCGDNIYARVNLALLLEEQLGDHRSALDNYERALELSPNDIRLMLKISSMYEISFANKRKAIEYLEKANELAKDEPFIKENLDRLRNS